LETEKWELPGMFQGLKKPGAAGTSPGIKKPGAAIFRE
jgi:hypothetical protein